MVGREAALGLGEVRHGLLHGDAVMEKRSKRVASWCSRSVSRRQSTSPRDRQRRRGLLLGRRPMSYWRDGTRRERRGGHERNVEAEAKALEAEVADRDGPAVPWCHCGTGDHGEQQRRHDAFLTEESPSMRSPSLVRWGYDVEVAWLPGRVRAVPVPQAEGARHGW